MISDDFMMNSENQTLITLGNQELPEFRQLLAPEITAGNAGLNSLLH
jgi:hypothetical protein